ncbi:pseudouridine synthase [Kickxella alabastrina]|uniref:pseudouridine synthase n=1 Tax=Kickxella alabastrina TaxID=61397 RepID=UPI00221EEB68|nr:pseudouridine synthase [Kickxella alabastrina]KAI7827706.1 pseudouridine synthase [Kickxella alabastrina]
MLASKILSIGANVRTIRVPAHASGLRVDRFILEHASIPQGLLFKLLRKRSIAQIDDVTGKSKRLQGFDKVQPGMVIRLPNTLVTAATDTFGDGKNHTEYDKSIHADFIRQQLPVIHENDAMAVFQKPPGLSCQGGSNVKYSVDKMLAEIDGSLETGYRLVHRLDRGTTGALVVAKSRLAAAALTKAFRDRSVDKKYIAVLSGIPVNKQGTVDHPLFNTGTMTIIEGGEGAANNGAAAASAAVAKEAITRYRVMRTGKWRGENVSIVELDLLTGRKHQIRAHCAQVLGCPVLGDQKYAGAQRSTDQNMYLHLFKLTVPGEVCDPSTLSVTAPFPEFWKPIFSALGVSLSSKPRL